ncbi:hypothetical protein F4677DRAFT_441925 [Hypoxylon crocopeplum]|nr:hypothetical protein F4677DRAFT_441925 [Hypoxylon crocopeplum]
MAQPLSLTDADRPMSSKSQGHIVDTSLTAGEVSIDDVQGPVANTRSNKRKFEEDSDYEPGPSTISKHCKASSRPLTRSQTRALALKDKDSADSGLVVAPEPSDGVQEPIVKRTKTRNNRKEDIDREPGTSRGPKRRQTKAPALNDKGSVTVIITDPHASKPEPHGQPPVWSEKRAALNDALSYFKAHQGSLYTKGLTAYGMLIDAEVGVRDYFSTQVIITSIGGGKVQDPSTRKMVRTQDQDDNCQNVKSLKKAIEEKHPFVLIAGAGNKLFPVKPPRYYNVLDYFYVTDLWSEVTRGDRDQLVKHYRVRLEKVNPASRSWWAPKNVTGHDAGEYKVGEAVCISEACSHCNVSSKTIFEHGWTCLNKACEMFFQLAASLVIDELQYNDAFLHERTPYSGAPFQEALIPPLPSIEGDSLGSEQQYKQGIVCPKCRCCSRRIKWDGWYCENGACDFKLILPIKMIPILNITKENELVKQSKKRSRFADPSVLTFKMVVGGFRLTTYFLPDERHKGGFIGSVTRIRPTKDARQREGGLTQLYQQLQKIEMDLQRRPAKNPGCRIEELTSHFSVNFGAAYKFGVAVDKTFAFVNAPSAILEVLFRIKWAGQVAVDATIEHIRNENIQVPEDAIPPVFDPYNEMLVLGYFEKSKISAHDDGEKELGPSVASMSLGSPSVISFSPKKGMKLGKEIDEGNKLRGSMLSILQKHGDMLVMHGHQIQQKYLHAVDPHGMHRFALTCRYIRPETIPDEQQRAFAAEAGNLSAEFADIIYNGEADQFESRVTREVVPSPSSVL